MTPRSNPRSPNNFLESLLHSVLSRRGTARRAPFPEFLSSNSKQLPLYSCTTAKTPGQLARRSLHSGIRRAHTSCRNLERQHRLRRQRGGWPTLPADREETPKTSAISEDAGTNGQ